ncbi:MAG: YdcF family protein [Bacillaceae bacterium]
MKKYIIIGACIALIGACSYFFYIHSLVAKGAKTEPEKGADYLLVLGARLRGETPSLSLRYRLDAATSYLKENPKTLAIVSGGQGNGETISEAEAMKRALVESGIDDTRIILEDKSTNTLENIAFSKKLLPPTAKNGIVVTNDYHVYRAMMLCKKEGLHVSGLPAKTPSVVVLKSYLREYLAVIKYKLFNHI